MPVARVQSCPKQTAGGVQQIRRPAEIGNDLEKWHSQSPMEQIEILAGLPAAKKTLP